MANDSHHVIPDPGGGWVVRRGGSERASKHFDRRQDAIEWGRQVSQNQQTELVIHRSDGTIREKDSDNQYPLPLHDDR